MKPPQFELSTDACNKAGGGSFQNDWFSNFSVDHPSFNGEHINCLEILTVLIAARRWGHLWTVHHIRVHCDHSASVYALNKGTSRSKWFMYVLRELFWLSVKYNFRLSAIT